MENTWTYPDTTGWYEAEFQVGDFRFVSKLDKNQELYERVMKNFPEPIFAQMNIEFISSQIAKAQAVTLSDIRDMLADINEYAHEAVIELVGA